MLYISRDKITITPDYPNYFFLKRFLIKIYLDKHVDPFAYMMSTGNITKYTLPEVEKQIEYLNDDLRRKPHDKGDCFYRIFYLYELDDENNMVVPIGYFEFIKPYIIPDQVKIDYELNNLLVNTDNVLKRLNDKILPSITLRKQQVEAIETALKLKKTLMTLPTGSRKNRNFVWYYRTT